MKNIYSYIKPAMYIRHQFQIFRRFLNGFNVQRVYSFGLLAVLVLQERYFVFIQETFTGLVYNLQNVPVVFLKV